MTLEVGKLRPSRDERFGWRCRFWDTLRGNLSFRRLLSLAGATWRLQELWNLARKQKTACKWVGALWNNEGQMTWGMFLNDFLLVGSQVAKIPTGTEFLQHVFLYTLTPFIWFYDYDLVSWQLNIFFYLKFSCAMGGKPKSIVLWIVAMAIKCNWFDLNGLRHQQQNMNHLHTTMRYCEMLFTIAS